MTFFFGGIGVESGKEEERKKMEEKKNHFDKRKKKKPLLCKYVIKSLLHNLYEGMFGTKPIILRATN